MTAGADQAAAAQHRMVARVGDDQGGTRRDGVRAERLGAVHGAFGRRHLVGDPVRRAPPLAVAR